MRSAPRDRCFLVILGRGPNPIKTVRTIPGALHQDMPIFVGGRLAIDPGKAAIQFLWLAMIVRDGDLSRRASGGGRTLGRWENVLNLAKFLRIEGDRVVLVQGQDRIDNRSIVVSRNRVVVRLCRVRFGVEV